MQQMTNDKKSIDRDKFLQVRATLIQKRRQNIQARNLKKEGMNNANRTKGSEQKENEQQEDKETKMKMKRKRKMNS